jgi:hypothetical protein
MSVNKKGFRTKLMGIAAGLFILQGVVGNLGVGRTWSPGLSLLIKCCLHLLDSVR